ncbi:MAG: YfhO family protein [Erysipelotrichaceae bacterium]|nr:YfhO family protein [Erysipelotrichaceae bacterium]
MKSKIKYLWDEYKILIIMLLISNVFIFYRFLFNSQAFEFQADQQLQFHYFYQEWITLVKTFIKTGTLPFYSWTTFLGTDFFATKLYYCTGDYFLPLYLLSPTTNVAVMEKYLTVLLTFISAFSMFAYLKEMEIKNRSVLTIVSYLYALCGIATLYFGVYMFHRFYAILPILFLAVERYLKHGKRSLFTFIVFLLFLQNYYFMFPTSLFLILYFGFSYSLKNVRFNLLLMLKQAWKLILAYLVGLMMSAVMLVPTVLFIVNNSRVGDFEITSLFWNIKVIIGFIFSIMIPPFNMFTNIAYPFYYGTNGHAHWYSVFTSVLSIFMIGYLLINKKFPKRKNYLIFLLIMLVLIMILPLNSIMHGFSEPSFRWIFLFVFLILLTDAKVLDNYWVNKTNYQRKTWITAIGWLIIIGSAVSIAFASGILNLKDFPEEIIALAIMAAVFIIYFIVLRLGCRKILFVLVFLEMTAASSFLINRFASEYYYYEPSISKEYVQYFNDLDSDILYRIYIDPAYLQPSSDMNLNQSILLGYRSTTTYDSTYENVLSPFLSYIGINWHIIDISDPQLLQLLGVKYIGVLDESELDPNYQYEYVYDLNAFHMYQLVGYNHLGHTFSSFVNQDTITGTADISWNTQLIVDQELLDDLGDYSASDKQQLIIESQNSNNNFNGTITVESKCVLFVSIPYSTGWQVTDNGQSVKTYNVDGGFMGIILEPGTHNLEFNYMSPGFKTGVTVSIIGGVGFISLIYFDFKKKRLLNK